MARSCYFVGIITGGDQCKGQKRRCSPTEAHQTAYRKAGEVLIRRHGLWEMLVRYRVGTQRDKISVFAYKDRQR